MKKAMAIILMVVLLPVYGMAIPCYEHTDSIQAGAIIPGNSGNSSGNSNTGTGTGTGTNTGTNTTPPNGNSGGLSGHSNS